MSDEKKGGFTFRKLLAWVLMITGAASILNFFAPLPIPTVGPLAIISGFTLLISGLIILNLKVMPWVKLLKDQDKSSQKPVIKIDPMLPVSILKIAKKHEGILTVSIVSVELDVPLDMAEAGLDECVRFGQATVDFDMKKEIKYYSFKEHMPEKIENKQIPDL